MRKERTIEIGARGGQTTIELALLFGVAVAALVGLGVYLQRAYQGYLYVNASVHGQQFDPTQPHSETPFLHLSQAQNIEVTAGQGTVILPSGGGPSLPGPLGDATPSSTPGGTLPGRILRVTVDATTDWSLTNDGETNAK